METVKNSTSLEIQLKQYLNFSKDVESGVPVSSIDFYLPYSSKINLSILDNSGNIAKSIVEDEYMQSGHYSKNIDLKELPAGEYLYKLETEKNIKVKSLMLSKKS